MAIPVQAVLWEPAIPELPLAIDEWQMYDLPEVGSLYWHGRTGYRVDRIEQLEDEIRVHLVHDPEWELKLLVPLASGHSIDGGRSSENGRWHFQVIGPDGRVVGTPWSTGFSLESAIRKAVAQALQCISATPIDPAAE